MKRILNILAFFLAFSWSVSAQSGSWSGKIDVRGTKLTIVFNFGERLCTVDSPDQGVKGIEAEKSYSPLGQLEVKIPSIGASFEGLCFPGMISGTFSQNGLSFPLTLNPGVPKLNRPQTPVGPFPYDMQEVSFANGETVLHGTLTTPPSCSESTPVVIMVTGSGIQNRDEEIFEHKPFAVIADALARAGIASLRYDDRGYGDPSVKIQNFTVEDFKNDALAGVNLLRKQFKNVGVLGHSEGGSIAYMLAAEGKVDFVISLAGAIVPFKDILVQQNDYALREIGFSETAVREYVEAISAAFEAIVAGKTPKNMDYSDLPEELKVNYKAAVMQCGTPYMKYCLSLDVRKILDKVTCPVLAFNGTLDTQVNDKENLEALKNNLASRDKTIVYVEGCNHLLQPCMTGSSSEYKDIDETISSDVLDIMTGWINKLFEEL